MEFVGLGECRRVSLPLLGQDMENDRLVLGLEKLKRSDQLSDRRVDYAPVCYVARPEDAIFVPYSAIVRCGGYLPSDISGFVKKSLSPGPPGVSRYANSSSTSACHPYHPSSETTK